MDESFGGLYNPAAGGTTACPEFARGATADEFATAGPVYRHPCL
jgi:hypothetical protein